LSRRWRLRGWRSRSGSFLEKPDTLLATRFTLQRRFWASNFLATVSARKRLHRKPVV
jgi:hypothetical protein